MHPEARERVNQGESVGNGNACLRRGVDGSIEFSDHDVCAWLRQDASRVRAQPPPRLRIGRSSRRRSNSSSSSGGSGGPKWKPCATRQPSS